MRSPCRPPADLEQCIAERRDELVKILLRKDEEVRRTSVVRSGSQVFGLAPDRFGSTCSFDPAEHPPSKVFEEPAVCYLPIRKVEEDAPLCYTSSTSPLS